MPQLYHNKEGIEDYYIDSRLWIYLWVHIHARNKDNEDISTRWLLTTDLTRLGCSREHINVTTSIWVKRATWCGIHTSRYRGIVCTRRMGYCIHGEVWWGVWGWAEIYTS